MIVVGLKKYKRARMGAARSFSSADTASWRSGVAMSDYFNHIVDESTWLIPDRDIKKQQHLALSLIVKDKN